MKTKQELTQEIIEKHLEPCMSKDLCFGAYVKAEKGLGVIIDVLSTGLEGEEFGIKVLEKDYLDTEARINFYYGPNGEDFYTKFEENYTFLGQFTHIAFTKFVISKGLEIQPHKNSILVTDFNGVILHSIPLKEFNLYTVEELQNLLDILNKLGKQKNGLKNQL